ncbi:hypothetical protein AVEN_118965-1, partial [Araneus ventricosus]
CLTQNYKLTAQGIESSKLRRLESSVEPNDIFNGRTPPHAPVPATVTATEPVEWTWDDSKNFAFHFIKNLKHQHVESPAIFIRDFDNCF